MLGRSFEQRITHLKKEEEEQYSRIARHLCSNHTLLQDELLAIIKETLALTDAVIRNSNGAYH